MSHSRRSHRGRHRSSTPPPRRDQRGFHRLGLDEFLQILLPGFAGPDKREFYNGIARGSVVLFGMLGLVAGTVLGGPLLAVIGFGMSVLLASGTAIRGRFFRRGRP